jgi:predicted SAM-dependent methyltransferase
MICSYHVLEHLDDYELEKVLRNIRIFLSHKGNLRNAVPDGSRPDEIYISNIKPLVDGHKQLITFDSHSSLLQSHSFNVHGLEYYKNNKLYCKNFTDEYGYIKRSFKNESQENFKYKNHFYTSTIIDCSIENN